VTALKHYVAAARRLSTSANASHSTNAGYGIVRSLVHAITRRLAAVCSQLAPVRQQQPQQRRRRQAARRVWRRRARSCSCAATTRSCCCGSRAHCSKTLNTLLQLCVVLAVVLCARSHALCVSVAVPAARAASRAGRYRVALQPRASARAGGDDDDQRGVGGVGH
jgi:hypothetical protein